MYYKLYKTDKFNSNIINFWKYVGIPGTYTINELKMKILRKCIKWN